MDGLDVTRYDYVRMVCRMAPGYGGIWKEEMLKAVPDDIKRDEGIDPRHGQITNMWDGKTKRPTMFIELWGVAADRFMLNVPTAYYATITRLDVRAEIPTLPIDYIEMLREVKKVKTNARRTNKYIDSPPRTKKDGRDAGGSSVIVGAAGSRRRLCVYLRTGSKTALEVQFGDGEPARYASLAKDAVERDTTGLLSTYAALKRIALQGYYDAVSDMSGHSYAEFAHLEFWQSQDEIFNSQEELLTRMDETWDRMDPEAQSAFVTAHLAPYTATFAPTDLVETADEMIEAVAPITYTDAELDQYCDAKAGLELINGEDRDYWEY